eukprot:jgi/Psemu1/36060/gm1.36060_g
MRLNYVEHGIWKSKDYFVTILTGINPAISAYTQVHEEFDFNMTPMAPLGCKQIVTDLPPPEPHVIHETDISAALKKISSLLKSIPKPRETVPVSRVERMEVTTDVPRVKEVFNDRKSYEGTIVGYNPKSEYYQVTYLDDDMEDFTDTEVEETTCTMEAQDTRSMIDIPTLKNHKDLTKHSTKSVCGLWMKSSEDKFGRLFQGFKLNTTEGMDVLDWISRSTNYTGDISNVYLYSSLKDPEYAHFKYGIIKKAWYGLKQSGKIVDDELMKHQAKFGCKKAQRVQDPFLHNTRDISFTLVVGDFGI